MQLVHEDLLHFIILAPKLLVLFASVTLLRVVVFEKCQRVVPQVNIGSVHIEAEVLEYVSVP